MKITLEEASDFGDPFLTLPDDSIIQVQVESITEREVQPKDGRPAWKKANFRFTITELPSHLQAEYGVLIGSTIFGSISQRFTTHPDNKMNQWSSALLDFGDLDAGFELDTDMLVGRKARAVIGSYTKKDNTRNHEVVGLLPLSPAVVGGGTSQATAISFDEDPPF